MENRIIPKHHQKFIELVASGINQDKSYKQTVSKNSTGKSCRDKGSQLATKYATEIAQARERYQTAIEQARTESVVQNALKSLLHQAEVDSILCAIIRGELLAEKKIIFMNREGQKVTTTLLCKPEHSEILKAIDIYNKRFGSYAAEKFNIKTDTIIKFSDAE